MKFQLEVYQDTYVISHAAKISHIRVTHTLTELIKVQLCQVGLCRAQYS